MKKFLSTLLALVMVLSAMSMIAMADEADAAPFQYPAYEKPEDYPTSVPGGGLAAIVILKPDNDITDLNDENAGKFSRVRFIFTPEHEIITYTCHWGIGSITPEGNKSFYMGDTWTWGHYLGEKYNYGSGHFTVGKDANGNGYFEPILVIPPNENGKWVDDEGTEYDTMYDMAAAGKLLGTLGEHTDPQGPGVPNGMINCDPSNIQTNWMATDVSPWPEASNLDAMTLRVVTEEEYYQDGDRTKLPRTEWNTLAALVVHMPDGAVYASDKEMYACKTSFVFKGWQNNPEKPGYEIAWGITILPKDENGAWANRPEFADGYTWYNCDNDADIILADGTELKTHWSNEQFKWFQDENGDWVFQNYFAIPADVIKAAGYKNLEEAAMSGAVIGSVREHKATDLEGVIDCGFPEQQTFKANAKTSDGKDAVIINGVSGMDYYGEAEYVPETQAPETTVAPETPAPETTAPSTTAPSTTAPVTGEAAGTETDAPAEESGCASSISMAVLAIAALAAAPVAFARKKH